MATDHNEIPILQIHREVRREFYTLGEKRPQET